MSDTRGALRGMNGFSNGGTRGHPDFPALTEGKIFRFLHLSFEGKRSRESGEQVFIGRTVLGVVGLDDRRYAATMESREGTVAAVDLALRASFERAGLHVPTLQLWPYHVEIVSRGGGSTTSAVLATATVSLNGWTAEHRVEHVDSVTAASLLLFRAYDHLFHQQWRQQLSAAGVTPEDALASLRASAETQRQRGAHA